VMSDQPIKRSFSPPHTPVRARDCSASKMLCSYIEDRHSTCRDGGGRASRRRTFTSDATWQPIERISFIYLRSSALEIAVQGVYLWVSNLRL